MAKTKTFFIFNRTRADKADCPPVYRYDAPDVETAIIDFTDREQPKDGTEVYAIPWSDLKTYRIDHETTITELSGK
jgi:hypothetical protein